MTIFFRFGGKCIYKKDLMRKWIL